MLLFYFFFLPEMTGRSLEEVNELFNARVPARKFATYQCAIHEEIIQVAAKSDSGEVVEMEVV